VRRHLSGIDHVVIAVNDLDAAAATYTRLGFTLTPRGFHSFGSQNHCAMFAADYLELLAVPAPREETRAWSDFLRDGEGVASIALKTDDAAAGGKELSDDGIEVPAAVELSRPVATPQGEKQASFRLARLPTEYTPGVTSFLTEHLTRDVVWQPDMLRHRNGVRGLRKIVLETDDPQAAALLWSRVFATAPSQVPQGWAVHTGGVPLVVASAESVARTYGSANLPSRPRPRVAALHLSVANAGEAAAVLGTSGARGSRLASGGACIAAVDAHGVALVFEG
jgi:catechol 2,3-dioxygenase-like lactoylglutathione lyase family enzyme